MSILKYQGQNKENIDPPVKVKAQIINMDKKATQKYKTVDVLLTRYSGLNWNKERIFVGKLKESYLIINENQII